MKSWTWPIVLVAAIAVVLGIEEWRISKLERRLAAPAAPAAQATPADPVPHGGGRIMSDANPAATRPSRSDRPPAPAAGVAATDMDADSDEDSIPKTLRKMADNPATKAMMNQGLKAMTGVWFADLVGKLDLNDEEKDYFLNLVAGGFADQQQSGMKLMDAKDDAARKEIMAEIEAAKEKQKQAIKEFLNSDDDFKAYEDYTDRLPERQQLDGLRAVMNEAGKPLDPEQETKVMEAVYQARKSRVDSVDWEGSGGMEAIASGDAAAIFERDWDKNSKRTLEEVSKVLDGGQLDAFTTYQQQMKEMQLMGIRMAAKMFGDQEQGGQPASAPAPAPDQGR